MSSDLSDEAKALVREGQRVLRPTAADKSRIAMALKAKLEAPQLVPEAPPQVPEVVAPAAGTPWVGKVAALTGGVLTVAAISYYLTRGAQPEVPSDVIVTPAIVSIDPVGSSLEAQPNVAPSNVAAPNDAVPVETLPSASIEARVGPESTSSSKLGQRGAAADSLAQEAALLAEAEKAFHAGNFTRALMLTGEHRVKFPKGLLARERVHLRVQLLCALGRDAEADKELRHLTKLGGQAVKACGRTP